MNTTPSAVDALACQGVFFEWAESYDLKDWKRLEACLAPVIEVDYSSMGGHGAVETPATSFIANISRRDRLGDPVLKTQHFLGASKWEQTSDTEIIGHHQLIASHLQYIDETFRTPRYEGVAHGTNVFKYKKLGDQWKLAGMLIYKRWMVGDVEKMFQSSRRPQARL